MREKRRYNGALRILVVFWGRASQPANQGGGGGGGFPKPPNHPAAARRSSIALWNNFLMGCIMVLAHFVFFVLCNPLYARYFKVAADLSVYKRISNFFAISSVLHSVFFLARCM